MTKTETKQALKDAEDRLKKHGDGNGALDKPAVPKREGLTHGPIGGGPTAPHKIIR
jgi:hypothetical protein